MDIGDIIRIYGTKSDYYEMSTNRIFKFTKMTYNETKNETSVPVDQDGDIIGFIKISGDASKMSPI